MESIHPKEIDLGLERVQEVARRLHIDASNAKVITVAGTNGKGSCVATLEKYLHDHGETVGAYTSPHLIRYNERIKINAEEVDDKTLCETFALIDRVREEITLTYFEFSTLAAYYLFNQLNLDYWLMEVGLGGRLDAVNIIDPNVAIITSIDIDHTEWLGDTREAIGREKAGILREGIIALCADENPPETIIEAFRQKKVVGYWYKKDFDLILDNHGCLVSLTNPQGQRESFTSLPCPQLPTPSVSAAVQALRLLGLTIEHAELAAHIQQSLLPGRFEKRVFGNNNIFLDVAHNPAATRRLALNIKEKAHSKLDAIVVMMSNKSHKDSLSPLIDLVDNWNLATMKEVGRAENPENLKNVLLELGVSDNKIYIFDSPESALVNLLEYSDKLKAQSPKKSHYEKHNVDENQCVKKEFSKDILVFGSFYLLGEIYPLVS